jgi:hypothetical protein
MGFVPLPAPPHAVSDSAMMAAPAQRLGLESMMVLPVAKETLPTSHGARADGVLTMW